MKKKKAIYLPTNQNTIILQEFDDYCEILLDGEYKTVLKNEIEIIKDDISISKFKDFKENIFLHIIKKPISDILYSNNSDRLTPQTHQYKPLIKFLNSQNSRILIADEVGLGKTIEAGMIFKEIDKREELKISLIVVPSSLTHKWKYELSIRFNEDFEIYKTNQFLNFIDDVKNYNSSKLIDEKIIISYHTLRDERVMKRLKDDFFEVDFLIMDEAHTMRNFDTSTFKSAEIITKLSEHIIFLTATPVQNSIQDLFNILSLLDNDYFKDYEYFLKMIKPNSTIHQLISMFRNHYDLQKIQNFIKENSKDDYPQELKEIFKKILELDNINNPSRISFIDSLTKIDFLSYIINRTKKKDVGLAIPRSAKSFTVNITKEEKDYYDAVIRFVEFLYPHLPQGFISIMPERMASSSMIASLESFKQIKKSEKIHLKDFDDIEDYYDDIDIKKEALKYLDDIIKKGELIGSVDSKYKQLLKTIDEIKSKNIKQIIIFSFFKKTIDYLEEKLKESGYSVGKIHGDFSTQDRFKRIKDFKDKKFDILLSTEVGSEGLDMQFCNVIINYDLPWNPMRVEQRIGRIDRIGQKEEKLYIFNLCIFGSIEERILNRLYSKLNIFESSIGELEPILGDIEKELDIASLIKLSQEEIDKKLKQKELAIEREKIEITKHSQEFDKMLNDEIEYQDKKEVFLNSAKNSILQQQTREIFTNFLEKNSIKYMELKDETIKLSKENIKKLFQALKNGMSDKRSKPLQYKQEKNILIKINRATELKVSFSSNSDDFNILYLSPINPIINIITRDKISKKSYSIISHKDYKDCFAIVYRVEFISHKSKSYIKTILLDKDLNFLEEIDYFTFINDAVNIKNIDKNINFKEIETTSQRFIIKSINKLKERYKKEQNRQIEIKINSIKSYFKKRINQVKKTKGKLSQKDVLRMREAEIVNLEKQRDKKVSELKKQLDMSNNFEILGILGVV